MPNKANFQKSQMLITIVSTTNYNEKCKLDTWLKRTQTKPILPAMAGEIASACLGGAEGEDGSLPVVSLSNQPKGLLKKLHEFLLWGEFSAVVERAHPLLPLKVTRYVVEFVGISQ